MHAPGPPLTWLCIVWLSLSACGPTVSAAPVDRAACVTWARMVQAIAGMDEKNRDHLPELIALPQVPVERARLALRALAYVRAGDLDADSAFDRALGSCEGTEL